MLIHFFADARPKRQGLLSAGQDFHSPSAT
jgi:hypothetical protein